MSNFDWPLDYNDVPDDVNNEYVDDYNVSEEKDYMSYEDYSFQRTVEDYGYDRNYDDDDYV